MSEKTQIVGASHEFHNSDYAQWWADAFSITPERLSCFDHMGDILLSTLTNNSTVLELGSGPGYFANYVLTRFPNINYVCLDFSNAMIDIARRNLEQFTDRVTFIQADLRTDGWQNQFTNKFSAIVSTWALHDLESRQCTLSVYSNAKSLLNPNGLFINSDFIKPTDISKDFEAGRYEVELHIEDFMSAGYTSSECSMLFEVDTLNPASHNNYACIIASA